MSRRKENIAIESPPLEKFKRDRSCLKQSCLSGCGCFFLCLIGVAFILHLLIVPRPKNVNGLPKNFPVDIIVYDKDSIERITHLSDNKKNRPIEILTTLPKIILSPILISVKRYAHLEEKKSSFLKNIELVLVEPIEPNTDTTKIIWQNLNAEPDFILNLYSKELKREQYTLIINENSRQKKSLSFRSNLVYGSLIIMDNPSESGTTKMILTVDYKKQ